MSDKAAPTRGRLFLAISGGGDWAAGPAEPRNGEAGTSPAPGREACLFRVREAGVFPAISMKNGWEGARWPPARVETRMTGRAAAMSFPAFRRECVTHLRDGLLRLALLPSCGCHRKSPPPWGHGPSSRLDQDFQGRPSAKSERKKPAKTTGGSFTVEELKAANRFVKTIGDAARAVELTDAMFGG